MTSRRAAPESRPTTTPSATPSRAISAATASGRMASVRAGSPRARPMPIWRRCDSTIRVVRLKAANVAPASIRMAKMAKKLWSLSASRSTQRRSLSSPLAMAVAPRSGRPAAAAACSSSRTTGGQGRIGQPHDQLVGHAGMPGDLAGRLERDEDDGVVGLGHDVAVGRDDQEVVRREGPADDVEPAAVGHPTDVRDRQVVVRGEVVLELGHGLAGVGGRQAASGLDLQRVDRRDRPSPSRPAGRARRSSGRRSEASTRVGTTRRSPDAMTRVLRAGISSTRRAAARAWRSCRRPGRGGRRGRAAGPGSGRWSPCARPTGCPARRRRRCRWRSWRRWRRRGASDRAGRARTSAARR